jgi:hypothetical protein
MRALIASWYDVVKRKLFVFPAAVLTLVFVPVKYLELGHFTGMRMFAYQVDQPDDRRDLVAARRSRKIATPILHHLSFADKHKYYRPAHFADIQRQVILI